MMIHRFARRLVVSAVLATPAIALADAPPMHTTESKPAKLSATDVATIGHLHALNQAEIQMGKLAQQNGQAAGVKAFGKTLVTDHTAADKDLLSFAKQRAQVVPTDKPMTDADTQAQKDDMATMAALKKARGADFDRQFLAAMVTGHDRELAKLDTAIGNSSDADFTSLLNGIKPVMQGHATTAHQLQNDAPQAAK